MSSSGQPILTPNMQCWKRDEEAAQREPDLPAGRGGVRGVDRFHSVMAGLVPAIHALRHGTENVDARDKPGHDDLIWGGGTYQIAES
nr:hypothetical protein CIT39_11395 [Bradyrhizobium symbiodeficiens]